MTADTGQQTIVVTGGGSGIGNAIVRRAIAAGYAVSAWDVDEGALAGLNRPGLSFHRLDVRDKAAMEGAVAGTVESGGTIVGLAACAAVYKPVPFLELDDAAWDRHLDINLKGTLLASQAVLPGMRRRGNGAIVMFSSSIARNGAAGGAHYAATKGGVLGLARAMALETARDGIRVNVISPGITDTPQPRGHRSQADLDAAAAANPMGRIGAPEDMAEAALFLMEDDASFVTGQDIRINGGRLMI
ncbi:MAG: SDR family NAD(P)-dependent oxidoreductase [Defluviicoccus sp.]|nr:SDR family NAD(P)-dependent oxidoreductase [Defluviicoccus sp.]